MIRNLGGGSITRAVKRAWNRAFSMMVMATVNWKGRVTKKRKKKGLKESIISKVVFGTCMLEDMIHIFPTIIIQVFLFYFIEAVRKAGGRRAKDYEMEKLTKSLMKGMPEAYCNFLKVEDEKEVNENDLPGNGGGSS